VGRPAGQAPLEHAIPDPLGTGQNRRVLITGAGGQLGAALREVFPEADARDIAGFDVTSDELEYQPGLVLHAAAWTDVDGAERDPDAARLVNVEGTARVADLGAPVVYYSTDYVFDGAKREPYVESDEPNPLSAYGRTKLDGEREIREGWIVRSSWLYGWTGKNFVRTMLELAGRQDEVEVVEDQVGCPTYVGHLAAATRDVVDLPQGVWHLAADGACTWAEFAAAIFEEAGIDCRVRPVSTEQLGRPAPRPAYSVLRSERPDAPRLPHWREGLRACLERLKGH
jgi:dTDP-4-dehydrorhamnose reductase